MRVIRRVADMQRWANRWRTQGRTIGFVPTMGALHEGHLSLVARAQRDHDVCVVSIFVNPLQFGPREDFHRYPRPFANDRARLRRQAVDVLFAPSVREMYPENALEKPKGGYAGLTIDPPAALVSTMDGLSRPGHFRGVATIVGKLFHAVMPHEAYFGQKDAQQCAVIRSVTRDLLWPVRIRVMPIVREADGLAMSSRNRYLSSREREAATSLFRSLREADRLIRSGERDARRVVARMNRALRRERMVRAEYAVAVDPDTLQPKATLKGRVLIAVAARVGATRLIDNEIFRVV